MFYTYYQNRSKGVLYQDENVGRYVVIEGDTLEEIRDKAKKVFKDYMMYCPCCGERWEYLDYEDEEDLEEKPSVLECEDKFWRGQTIVVYYKNGNKKIFKHK